MAETVRSFIAFDLENETILKKLSDMQALLVKTGADLKLVEPTNIHITMRFLGDMTSGMAEKVYEVMRTIQFVPFDVKIHGVGAFPDVRYPRVCWTGITEGANQLRGISSQLEPRLQGLGFASDPRGFSPHLTMARVRSGRNKAELAKFIADNVNYDFGVIRVACLRLKKSDLTPRGPIYSTLKEYCPPSPR
jgi:2'-5' RNA ligase